jgi:hypothetical protein
MARAKIVCPDTTARDNIAPSDALRVAAGDTVPDHPPDGWLNT